MRKKKILISIVVGFVFVLLAGLFFLVKYDVVGKLYDVTFGYSQEKEDVEAMGDIIHETILDKDGNEIVIEMKKVVVEDEYGNKVEMYVDTAEPIIIEDKIYKGEITKIEDNKIYFMVDKEVNIADEFMVEDVEDYEIIIDVDTLDLEADSSNPYPLIDYLSFGQDLFYSAGDLVDMIGESLRVQNILIGDYYTGEEYRSIVFYLEEKI